MSKNKIAITLGVVYLILTIAICVQLKTVINTNMEFRKSLSENCLRDEVLKWKEKYDNISNELDIAEKRLAKIREQSTKNDATSSKKEEQITLNNNILGITNLVGQGVEITLKDDPNATMETIAPWDDISNHIIHDADLRAIVNELKNAGAEAISINDKRILNMTEIVDVNGRILINEEPTVSPFVVKAIGDQTYLSSALSLKNSGFVDSYTKLGKTVEMREEKNISILAYNGSKNQMQFKYAKEVVEE